MNQDATPPELSDAEHQFVESIFELARGGDHARLAEAVGAGVPANLTNASGDSLLILAAYHQHAEAVAVLIAAGADVDRVNDRGQTAMSCAVFRNNEPIVRALLGAGADPELGAHPALAIAQQFGLAEMVRVLAEHTAR